MIRNTVNATISSSKKDKTTNPGANYDGVVGVSLEHVVTNDGIGGGDIIFEKSDFQARLLNQSTTPSNAFNGTFE